MEMETQAPPAHTTEPRALCLRCLRPRRVCFCERLPELPSQTRVVFLQHLRERRMPIGTARMAHLSLPNSELRAGIDFETDERVQALCHEEGTFLLFPGPSAKDVRDLEPGELKTLVVVDGTWPLARKLIRVNPSLQALPRVMFHPERPGNYRIRKEPAEHCLATIEAVSEVLGHLEGDAERFRALLRPFDWMVDTQIALRDDRNGPSRYTKKKPRRPTPRQKVAAELQALCEPPAGGVLVYAESNPKPGSGGREREVTHLLAHRVGSGERFEALVRPEVLLDPSTPHHLELDPERILAGEQTQAALERWRAFLRPGDMIFAWGYFTRALLQPWAAAHRWEDLRPFAVRASKSKIGGIDEIAGPAAAREAWTAGRGGRRIRGLERIFDVMLRADPLETLQTPQG